MPDQYLAILEPHASPEAFTQALANAQFADASTVVVFPNDLSIIRALGHRIRKPVIALVGFPFGASKPVAKAIEATSCIKDGADGVWIVPRSLHREPEAFQSEILEIARALRAARPDAILGIVIDLSSLPTTQDIPTLRQLTRQGAADQLILIGDLDAVVRTALLAEPDELPIILGASTAAEGDKAFPTVHGIRFPSLG